MALTLKIQNNIGFIEFDQPQAKVNLLTADNLRTLDCLLDQVQMKKDIKVLVIKSLKKDIFIAGADIKEIENISSPTEAIGKAQAGQHIFNKLEDLAIPTVALLNGATLGGGCELALACRFRVGTFNEKLKIGLPEVNLGIIPGFGGTYRLVRLVGLSQGVRMISSGKVIGGLEALKIGLIDKLIPQSEIDQNLNPFLQLITDKKREQVIPARKKSLRLRLLEDNPLGRAVFFNRAKSEILNASKGFYPAPLKALKVIQKGITINRNQALKVEAQGFADLVITDVCKNLIRVFYLTEKYKKSPSIDTQTIELKAITKCAVLGAGIMGGGIAQLLSFKNMSVRLKDISWEAIGNGYQAAQKLYLDLLKRKRLKKNDVAVHMARISGGIDYSGFKNVSCVIEAVVENMDVKKKVFRELSEVVSAETVLCTNTSALSVTEIAKSAKDPSLVVGFHFFNPVHRMQLIEIIRTDLTSNDTLAKAFMLARQLDKTPILVKDSCGFLVNRILLIYINEAGRLLQEGYSIEEIDKVITDFGFPMGPFALCDEVGLDVGLKVLQLLHQAFGDRFKPVDLFSKILDKGFYSYNRKMRTPNPEIALILKRSTRTINSSDQLLKRMIYLMINEAARCVEEEIVDSFDTVDLGMMLGAGFPFFRGGLWHYAQSVGLKTIAQELKSLNDEDKDQRFSPCALLLKEL